MATLVANRIAPALLANRIAPALLDRYLAKTGYESQQTSALAVRGRPDNLFGAEDSDDGHDFGARGVFSGRSHNRSLQMWVSHHARQVAAARAGAAIAGGAVAAKLAHDKT